MKRILAALAAVTIMAVGIAGCSKSSDNGASAATSERKVISTTVSRTNKDDYEDNIKGLEAYLDDNGYMYLKKEDSKIIELDASAKGAIEAYRYEFVINYKDIIVEIYEFDVTHFNDKSRETIKSVHRTGECEMSDGTTAVAAISGSERYLMIYNDTSNPEEGMENYARRTNTLNAFEEF